MKAKLKNSKMRVQVEGVDKTPFVAQPTTISKKGVKETVVLWDHIKATETFCVVNQCMKKENLPDYEGIDKMYECIAKQIDERNKALCKEVHKYHIVMCSLWFHGAFLIN